MHHMNKTTALCIALAAATSCKPETVTLGVKKHDEKAKTQADSHDTATTVLKSDSITTSTLKGPRALLEETKRPGKHTSTHDTQRAPEAQKNVATLRRKGGEKDSARDARIKAGNSEQELMRYINKRVEKMGSTIHNLNRAINNEQNALKRSIEQKEGNIQQLKGELNAALKRASEEKETLKNEQEVLQRTIEQKDKIIQQLRGELNAALKRASEEKETLTNAQEELQRVVEERDKIIQTLKGGLPRALEHAAREGDVIFLKAFISAGKAVEEKEGQHTWQAYAQAALEMIEEKVDINAKDKDGNTLLHTAAKAGNTATVWALIAKGAKVNAKNKGGYTPLHLAARKGHKDVATLLIDNKADIHAKNILGYTPLHLAARKGHKDAVKALINAGANVQDALYHAAKQGDINVLKELINAPGAKVNAKDTKGRRLLHYAKDDATA